METKPVTVEDWKRYLAECLDATQFMVLGTAAHDGAWVAPVYFAFDESFTLYFVSEPSCVHMQNIEKDAHVSCAVYNTNQDTHSHVLGVQLVGEAAWITPEEAAHACDVYFTQTSARNPIGRANRPEEYANPKTVWRMAKIVPRDIWVFDEKNFGGSRLHIPPEVLGKK